MGKRSRTGQGKSIRHGLLYAAGQPMSVTTINHQPFGDSNDDKLTIRARSVMMTDNQLIYVCNNDEIPSKMSEMTFYYNCRDT